MAWELREAVEYYQKQGAPGDQTALLSLLRGIQGEFGAIPAHTLPELASLLGVKESFLLALIRRQPWLRLENTHVLELCAGPNCEKAVELAAQAERLCAGRTDIRLKFVPCMRQCGKGPNLRWDGVLYSGADKARLQQLLGEK